MSTINKYHQLTRWLPFFIGAIGVMAFLTPFAVFLLSTVFGLESGPVGDTIGGSTAPIIGFLSAILLFISFRAQTLANDIQREAIWTTRDEANFKYFIGELDTLKNMMEKYQHGLPGNRTERAYEGLEYFGQRVAQYIKDKDRSQDATFMKSIRRTRRIITFLENMLKEHGTIVLSEKFRDLYQTKFLLYYQQHLQASLTLIQQWNLPARPARNGGDFYQLAKELQVSVGSTIDLIKQTTENK